MNLMGKLMRMEVLDFYSSKVEDLTLETNITFSVNYTGIKI